MLCLAAPKRNRDPLAAFGSGAALLGVGIELIDILPR
jgi:hypothetical protein